MALKRLYTSRDEMEAHFLCALLEREGIAATVMGEMLANGLGTLPLGAATAPTVWVNEIDLPRASELVAAFDRNSVDNQPVVIGQSWTCPNCKEVIEAQFSDCWHCQTPRPPEPEASPKRDEGQADLTAG